MGTLCDYSELKSVASFRLCDVNGHKTELLEIQSDNPKAHVIFVPGNPGIVTFYKDFVEFLYDLLEGKASVTAIGHISFSMKNWEKGKLFSLQQQIDHKLDFIEQECIKPPIVLIGHSIGCYMSLEILRTVPEKIVYFIGLYPFIKVNPSSTKQKHISRIAKNPFLSTILSFTISTIGCMPRCLKRYIAANWIGRDWSDNAIDSACTHLVQYHTFRNMLFLANSEFNKLSEELDWNFMCENERKITFLFGVDDHWGPMQLYDEIAVKVPNLSLAIEREGHTHSFCVTEAGSFWTAQHVSSVASIRIEQTH